MKRRGGEEPPFAPCQSGPELEKRNIVVRSQTHHLQRITTREQLTRVRLRLLANVVKSPSDTPFCAVPAHFDHTFAFWQSQCIRSDRLLPTFSPMFSAYSIMSGCSRDFGQGSSWYYRDWTPPAKPHTKNSYPWWSKRGTRGYPSEYDGWSHHWEESKPIDPTEDSKRTAEIGNGADVEIVES